MAPSTLPSNTCHHQHSILSAATQCSSTHWHHHAPATLQLYTIDGLLTYLNKFSAPEEEAKAEVKAAATAMPGMKPLPKRDDDLDGLFVVKVGWRVMHCCAACCVALKMCCVSVCAPLSASLLQCKACPAGLVSWLHYRHASASLTLLTGTSDACLHALA